MYAHHAHRQPDTALRGLSFPLSLFVMLGRFAAKVGFVIVFRTSQATHLKECARAVSIDANR